MLNGMRKPPTGLITIVLMMMMMMMIYSIFAGFARLCLYGLVVVVNRHSARATFSRNTR